MAVDGLVVVLLLLLLLLLLRIMNMIQTVCRTIAWRVMVRRDP